MQKAIVSSKQRFEENDHLWKLVKQFLMYDKDVYIQLSKDKVQELFMNATRCCVQDDHFTFVNGNDDYIKNELVYIAQKQKFIVSTHFKRHLRIFNNIGPYYHNNIDIKCNVAINIMTDAQLVKITYMYTIENEPLKNNSGHVCSDTIHKWHSYNISQN